MTVPMKNIINCLTCVILFSWIIILGSSPTSPRVCDTGLSLCYPPIITGPVMELSILPCTNNFQQSISFSDVACDKDFCCKDKECDFDEVFSFNSHNSTFQKQFANYDITYPKHLAKVRVVNAIFDYHKSLLTNSIYIIIQSFRC